MSLSPEQLGNSIFSYRRLFLPEPNGSAPVSYTHLKEAFSKLKSVFALLQTKPYAQNIVLDFSIVNNMNYYNGITFQGFVKGIPTSVLSGGRYDNLLRKFGNSMNAVGSVSYTHLDVYKRQLLNT